MTEFVQISNVRLSQSELVPLLARSQLLPVVLRELTIDRSIIDIQCNDADKISAFQQFCDRHRLTSDDSIQQWLDARYLNTQQLEEIVMREFKIEKFKLANWGDKVETYFLQRKAQLDRAIYSLIRTNDLGVAQEIYFRLIAGEQTFAEIASQYSQGAESQTGGLIGPVEMSVPHPVIANLITTQPLGKICQPIKLDPWYAIVRPERLIPARLDEAMRQRLLDELFESWVREQMKSIDLPTTVINSTTERMKV
jgi:hypothetical protein